MGEIGNATAKDWKYLENLIRESGIIVEENKEKKELVSILCMNEELIKRYVQDGKNINICFDGETPLYIECK